MSNESSTPDQFAELREALRAGEKEKVTNAVEQLEQNGVSKEEIPADLQEHIDAILTAPAEDEAVGVAEEAPSGAAPETEEQNIPAEPGE